MSSYRLAYRNNQAFCVDIDSVEHGNGAGATVWRGIIYRVTRDTKESVPLHKSDGSTLVIHATSESTALAVAAEVLLEVNGAGLESVTKIEVPAALPDLRLV